MVGAAANAERAHMLAGLTCNDFLTFVGSKYTYPFDYNVVDSLHFIGFNVVRYVRRFDDLVGGCIQTYL